VTARGTGRCPSGRPYGFVAVGRLTLRLPE